MNVHPRVLSAGSIIGSKVVNTEGELLGNIKDMVVDLDDSQIAYAVLSFGGFMGVGDKLFAIPLEALTFDTKTNSAVLDVDKDVLKNAPGFDKDKWPDDAQYDAGWLLDIYEYYGYSPYWRPGK
ncbi:MAG TPA: PRC-barrel domain-containing protein [Anaerolineales bacterium]|nr:PRC-barrel domain-containing protein [Anaerolineales bacterium]